MIIVIACLTLFFLIFYPTAATPLRYLIVHIRVYFQMFSSFWQTPSMFKLLSTKKQACVQDVFMYKTSNMKKHTK